MAGLACLIAPSQAWSAGCVPPPSGLVSWWPGEGNANDITGTNNGVLEGSMAFVPGEVGQALSFDGTNADVRVPASPSLNVGAGGGLTIEAWIKPAEVTQQHPLVEWNNGNFGAHFWIAVPPTFGGGGPGSLSVNLVDTAGASHLLATPADLIDTNGWHHVAATYDKTKGITVLYVDGAAIIQKTNGVFTPQTAANLYLGFRPYGGAAGTRYAGQMDEVSIYSRALSGGEIAAIYSAGSAGKCKSDQCVPPPTGLVSWWQGEGNAYDLMGTNNGVLEGSVGFATGKVGLAFAFNGTNADVRVPASASLNVGLAEGFTIETWINPTDITQQHPIAEWNNGSFGVHFWIASAAGPGPGSLFIDVKDTGQTDHYFSTPTGRLVSNAWQHVAVTYVRSTGNTAIYINGVGQAQQTLGAFTPQTSGDLYFGLRPYGGAAGTRFAGLMDEISLYRRALSAEEIQAIYDAGAAGKCVTGSPPFISGQPADRTVPVGSTAAFTVTAAGTLPLSYQWQLNGTNLTGATDSLLVLANVQFTNAGTYSVVVTNLAGSVTSSNAQLIVIAAPPCVPPPAGLVSWWRGEGEATDTIGTNNGVLEGAVGFAAGEVDQALSFNGTNADVKIPASDSLNLGLAGGFTIEAWVNPADITQQHPVVEWNNGSFGVHLWIASVAGAGPGSLFIDVKDTSLGDHYFSTPAGSLVANIWQHIAVTYVRSNGYTVLYIDGQPRAQQTLGTFTPRTLGNLYLGLRPYGGAAGTRYAGLMDEVSVYNRALAAAEIQGIYDAGPAGKCRPVPAPRAATATANVVDGFVVRAAISDGGWGYTNTPAVKIIGGGGSGAQAVAVVSNGVVVAVNVLNAGFGYTSTPAIVIAPPFVMQPTVAITPLSFLSFTNLAVGTNYQLQVLGGSAWSNLGAAFTAASSTFTQYVPGAAGPNGYRLASTPVPIQAQATAQLAYGFIVNAVVTSGGSGYVTTPVVSIVGGGGSNATAVASISGGRVTGITITDAGIGYTSTPAVVIAAPPVDALWPLVTQAMELGLSSLSAYDDYQVEFTPVVGGAWSNLGLPFTPTSTTNSQYINVNGDAGFFRVKHLP